MLPKRTQFSSELVPGRPDTSPKPPAERHIGASKSLRVALHGRQWTRT